MLERALIKRRVQFVRVMWVLEYHISLLNHIKFQFIPQYSMKCGAHKANKYTIFFHIWIVLLIVLKLPFSEARLFMLE